MNPDSNMLVKFIKNTWKQEDYILVFQITKLYLLLISLNKSQQEITKILKDSWIILTTILAYSFLLNPFKKIIGAIKAKIRSNMNLERKEKI